MNSIFGFLKFFSPLYLARSVQFNIGGGGGGSAPAPTSQTVSNTNIPPELMPYATANLASASALTDINQNPYQQYGGNRIAGFNPLQTQSLNSVQNMQASPAIGAGMGMAGAAGIGSLNANYNAQNFGNQYGSGPQFQNMGLNYLSTNAPNFGQQSAQNYMSPYAQQAIDPTLRENQRQFDVASTGRQAAATRSGAFGGSRQAIEQSEAQRNLGRLQSDTQAQGMQAAYQNAQQQFNADQARGMQSQLANQGAYGQMQGLGMQQNLSANQQDMQNRQLQAQYGLAGQQAGEQSNQFASNYDLQNRQAALAAAQGLGSLGMQNYQQNMGIAQAQALGGAQVQAQEQQELSQNYQDFLNQQNYPYKQLGFMSDLIRGTPTSGGAATMYQAPPSAQSQTVGLLGGLGSLAGAYTASQPKQ